MAKITTTGNLTQPDITTKVSPASLRVGVTGNILGGTASSNNVSNASSAVILGGAGASNANIGGVVYRAAGQSSNQFPVSAATKEPGAPTGGAGQAGSNGSTNPVNIQEQVASRKATEAVTPSMLNNIAGPGVGELVKFPKTTETADFGSSSSIKSNISLNREQASNAYVGITTPKAYSSQDPAKLADDKRVVADTNGVTGGREDGAAQGANSVDKFVALGDNVQTQSMNTLPGGVDQSQKIG